MNSVCKAAIKLLSRVKLDKKDGGFGIYVQRFFAANNISVDAMFQRIRSFIDSNLTGENIESIDFHFDIKELCIKADKLNTKKKNKTNILLLISIMASFQLIDPNFIAGSEKDTSNMVYEILLRTISTSEFLIFKKYYIKLFKVIFDSNFSSGNKCNTKLHQRLVNEEISPSLFPLLECIVTSTLHSSLSINIIRYFVDTKNSNELVYILLFAVSFNPKGSASLQFMEKFIGLEGSTESDIYLSISKFIDRTKPGDKRLLSCFLDRFSTFTKASRLKLAETIIESGMRDFEIKFVLNNTDNHLAEKLSDEDPTMIRSLITGNVEGKPTQLMHPEIISKLTLNDDTLDFVNECLGISIFNRIRFSEEGLDVRLAENCFTNEKCFEGLSYIAPYASSIKVARTLFENLSPDKYKPLEDYTERIEKFSKLLHLGPTTIPMMYGTSSIEISGFSRKFLSNGFTAAFRVFIEPSDFSVQTPIFSLNGKAFSFAFSIINKKIIIVFETDVFEMQEIEIGKEILIGINIKMNSSRTVGISTTVDFVVSEEKTIPISDSETEFTSLICFGPSSLPTVGPLGFLSMFAIFPYDKLVVNMESWSRNPIPNPSSALFSACFSDDDKLSMKCYGNRLKGTFKPSPKFLIHPLYDIIVDDLSMQPLMPLFAFASQDSTNKSLIAILNLLIDLFKQSDKAQIRFIEINGTLILFHILTQCPDSFFDLNLLNTLLKIIYTVSAKVIKRNFLQIIFNTELVLRYEEDARDKVYSYWISNYNLLEDPNILDLLILYTKVQNAKIRELLMKLCENGKCDMIVKSLISFCATNSNVVAIKDHLILIEEIFNNKKIKLQKLNIMMPHLYNLTEFGDEDIVILIIQLFKTASEKGYLDEISLTGHFFSLNFKKFYTNKFLGRLIELDIDDLVPKCIEVARKLGEEAVDTLFTQSSLDFSLSYREIIDIICTLPSDRHNTLYNVLFSNNLSHFTDIIRLLFGKSPDDVMPYLFYVVDHVGDGLKYKATEVSLLLHFCYFFILFRKIDGSFVFKLNIDENENWLDIEFAKKCLKLFQCRAEKLLLFYDSIVSAFLMRFEPDFVRSHLINVSSLYFNSEMAPFTDFLAYNGNRFNIDLKFLKVRHPSFEAMELLDLLKAEKNTIMLLSTLPPKPKVIDVNKLDTCVVESAMETRAKRDFDVKTMKYIALNYWQILWFRETGIDGNWKCALYPKPVLTGYEKIDNFLTKDFTVVRFKNNKHYTSHARAVSKRDSGKNKEAIEEYTKEEAIIDEYNKEVESIPELFRVKNYTNGLLRAFELIVSLNGEYEPTIMQLQAIHISTSKERRCNFEIHKTYISYTSDSVTKAFKMDDIEYCYPRTHFHRHDSVQLVLKDGSSYFFSFPGNMNKNIVKCILENAHSAKTIPTMNELTKKWINHEITNFTYLMNVNNMSGRNTQDVSQYPIMPWVLASYRTSLRGPPLKIEEIPTKSETFEKYVPIECKPEDNYIQSITTEMFRDFSKPLGAMNEERLNYLKIRSESMEPPYLYGSTQISAPSCYLLHIREEPFTSLHIKFQSGQFDRVMRIFTSIPQNFEISLTQRNDFFEITPEFFSQPEFLINYNHFSLGPVSDVILPPWANTPDEFIYKHRRILELCSVSEWIDLIWGYKQMGEEATKAFNVYMPYLYSNVWEQENVPPAPQIEIMLRHIGQIPPPLFSSKHPERNSKEPLCGLTEKHTFQTKKDITQYSLEYKNNELSGLAADSRGNVYSITGPFDNVTTTCIGSYDSNAIFSINTSHSFIYGQLRNKIIMLKEPLNNETFSSPASFGRTLDINASEDTCVVLTDDCSAIFWDNTVMMQKIMIIRNDSYKQFICSAVRKEFDLAVICSEDTMKLCSLRKKQTYKNVKLEKTPRKVFISPVFGYIVVVCDDEILLYNVNGRYINKCSLVCKEIDIFDVGGFDFAVATTPKGLYAWELFFMKPQVIAPDIYGVPRYLRGICAIISIDEDGHSIIVPFTPQL